MKTIAVKACLAWTLALYSGVVLLVLPGSAAPAAVKAIGCPNCKRPPKPGWKSCAYCGTSLAARLKVGTLGVPAEIWVDGIKRGRTGELITGIPSGVHQVSIISPTHVRLDRTVKFSPGKLETLTLSLVSLTGSITVETNAKDATVLVDGKTRGKPDETINGLTAGLHVVEVQAQGYRSARRMVTVGATATTPVKLDLISSRASIHIADSGTSDEVYLDGKSYGTTPTIIREVAEGMHRLEIRFSGAAPIVRELRLSSEQVKRIDPVDELKTKVTHTPERLEISPDGRADVTYTFSYPSDAVMLQSRSASFHTPTGVSISEKVGPYLNPNRLPIKGKFSWMDRTFLPAEVARKARELGYDTLLLRQSFLGTRRDGTSISWEVSVPIRIR